MATDVSTPPAVRAPTHTPKPGSAEDLGIDRAFVVGLARIPVIAVAWAAAAWVLSLAVAQLGWFVTISDTAVNVAPLAVICAGMVVAAVIDGVYFKVPNWCTLSLVVSGWYIGALHDFGAFTIPGLVNPSPDAAGQYGGFLAALGCTAIGFACLFPALFIGGMGQGDVKMTMGFGSWLGAYFGLGLGASVLFWSFALGVLIGGVFGLVIMAMRRQFYKNLANVREIITDLHVMVTDGPGKAAERANSRRSDWWRLPYGVPLCVGFLGYLWYAFFVAV